MATVSTIVRGIHDDPVPAASNEPVPAASKDTVPDASNDQVPAASNEPVPAASEDTVPEASNDPVHDSDGSCTDEVQSPVAAIASPNSDDEFEGIPDSYDRRAIL
jgi:hypothetical protein